MLGSINWNAADAFFGGLGVTLVVATGVGTRTGRWRMQRKRRDHELDLLRLLVYGRKAEGPLPEIMSISAAHELTTQRVTALEGNMAELKQQVHKLDQGVEKLLVRTQANGGTSLKDQLTRIEQAIHDKQ